MKQRSVKANREDEKYTYKLFKDSQVCVEAVLIGLLNTFSSVTVKQTRMQTTVTMPFIPIKSIELDKYNEIDFEYVVERGIEEKRLYDI